jgi:hypothetical protein
LAVKYKETEDERNGEIQREYLDLPDGYIVKYYCHKNTAKIETKICAIIVIFLVMHITSIIIQKLQDYIIAEPDSGSRIDGIQNEKKRVTCLRSHISRVQ